MRYRRKRVHESSGLREREVEGLDPAEFLARVIMHIPEPRRHLVRYYGLSAPIEELGEVDLAST